MPTDDPSMPDFLALIPVAVLLAVNLTAVLLLIAAATAGDEAEDRSRHGRESR